MTEPASNQPAKAVAFFDFDGTLTTGDTLMPFLKFVVGAPKYYAKLALLSPIFIAYFAKLIPNDIAKQIVLKQYLAGYHSDEILELGKRFSEEIIPKMLRHEGMKRFLWHRNQGHECVLVSASLDVYLDSWAATQGFKSLICTTLDKSTEGYISGKIIGENCYGKEKCKRIAQYQHGKEEVLTYAYGDTKGDLHMLLLVDYGFLVKRKGIFLYRKSN